MSDGLAHADRLDGPVCRDGQRSSVVSYEDALTALLMPPVEPVLAGYGLKITDLPVKLASPHGSEELGRRIHPK